MIKIICDRCNCEAEHFASYELSKQEKDKLSIEYNYEFKNRLIKTIDICPSCGDSKDFIHIIQ